MSRPAPTETEGLRQHRDTRERSTNARSSGNLAVAETVLRAEIPRPTLTEYTSTKPISIKR